MGTSKNFLKSWSKYYLWSISFQSEFLRTRCLSTFSKLMHSYLFCQHSTINIRSEVHSDFSTREKEAGLVGLKWLVYIFIVCFQLWYSKINGISLDDMGCRSIQQERGEGEGVWMVKFSKITKIGSVRIDGCIKTWMTWGQNSVIFKFWRRVY